MHTCMHLTMGIIMIHVSVYTHEHIHVFIQGHVGPSLGKKKLTTMTLQPLQHRDNSWTFKDYGDQHHLECVMFL